MHNIYGVPPEWCAMIIFFWIVLGIILFGFDEFSRGPAPVIAAFLAFGSILLIGRYGWQILIVPSVVLLLFAGTIILRRLR